ncbi:MAG TPA: hypothetical protein VFV38_04115, partial [Ktedonobacteraceae bacterium]|nr:hypothetical protein [Ktedonobacteraceae bacterium]
MSFNGKGPSRNQDPNAYIQQRIIEPLLTFRQTVSPLNQIHIDNVTLFAKTIAGLLTGSDGETAFQGPGSVALAGLIGNYLDQEENLAGSYTDLLQGRLLDASVICEKYAHQLRQNIPKSKASSTSFLLFAANEGGDFDIADDVADETAPEYWSFQSDIENGPNTEPLCELPPLGPDAPPVPQALNSSSSFLKLLGITIGIGAAGLGAYVIFNGLPVDPDKKVQQLTADERAELIKYLTETYGCSPQQVQAIMQKLGYQSLTASQLERIIQVLKIRDQLQTLLNETQSSSTDTSAFQRMLKGDLNTIDKDIRTGHATNWTDANVEGWENNLSGWAYQWEAAQALNATQIETRGTDFIGSDGTWYETKNVNNIQYDDDTYIKILSQLRRYASMGAPSVGVVVPPDADPNLLNELKKDLAKYGIYNVKVV